MRISRRPAALLGFPSGASRRRAAGPAAALALAFLSLLAAPRLPAAPQETAAPAIPPAAGRPVGDGLTLVDRIVAVVDEDPILESDIDRVIGLGGLGLATPNPGESEKAFRRRVLERLIDDRVRLHEIDRFGFVQVPIAEVERQVAEIRSRFGSEEELERRLRELGLTVNGLRQLLARQLMVMAYVEERLGPRVFVTVEDIQAYYRDVLVPEMQRRGQPVPPLEEVRERIRSLLREQRLNEEIERWTAELKEKADVASYFDAPVGPPLPPLIERIERPALPGSRPPP